MCPDSQIPCANFGTSIDIAFHKPDTTTTTIVLSHGSMYIMHPPINQDFSHRIPVQADIKKESV